MVNKKHKDKISINKDNLVFMDSKKKMVSPKKEFYHKYRWYFTNSNKQHENNKNNINHDNNNGENGSNLPSPILNSRNRTSSLFNNNNGENTLLSSQSSFGNFGLSLF